jgi:hypothetical protein
LEVNPARSAQAAARKLFLFQKTIVIAADPWEDAELFDGTR